MLWIEYGPNLLLLLACVYFNNFCHAFSCWFIKLIYISLFMPNVYFTQLVCEDHTMTNTRNLNTGGGDEAHQTCTIVPMSIYPWLPLYHCIPTVSRYLSNCSLQPCTLLSPSFFQETIPCINYSLRVVIMLTFLSSLPSFDPWSCHWQFCRKSSVLFLFILFIVLNISNRSTRNCMKSCLHQPFLIAEFR